MREVLLLLSGLFAWRTKSLVGLDIGTSRVKMVELAAKRGSVELVRAAVELTPVDAIRDGKVVRPDLVAGTIRKAMAAGRFRPGEVVAAIAGQGVVVRHAKFPRMPEDELKQAMKWEAQKYIPFPVEKAVMDYSVMRRDSEDQSMDVMIVASPNDLIESHLQAIELAGLTPTAIDVQPFTVLRALKYQPQGSQEPPCVVDGTVAYIYIGAGTTDIVIARDDDLRFTRIVPVGGATFTRAIAERLGISFEEAERVKIERGRVCADGIDSLDGDDRAMAQAIMEVVQAMVEDVRRSIDYHDLQLNAPGDGLEVKQVILAGGGSVLDGLDRYVGDELGLPTKMCNPLRNVAVSPRVASRIDIKKMGPMLAVGIGLALREVVD